MECLLAMAAMSAFLLLSLKVSQVRNTNAVRFYDAYSEKQAQAMAENERTDFEEAGSTFYFNEKGNVPSARTIMIDGKIYIIELGTGRLVEGD